MKKQHKNNLKPQTKRQHAEIIALWNIVKRDPGNVIAWKDLRYELVNLQGSYDNYIEQTIACINSPYLDATYLYQPCAQYLHEKLIKNPNVIPTILLTLMKKIVISNIFFEHCFTIIRANTYLACANEDYASFNEEYIEAISTQCFLNEYAYPCTEKELKGITQLLGVNIKKCLAIKLLDKKTKYLLMLTSCYFPLFDIFSYHPGLLELCEAINFCPAILKMQIYNIIEEKKIKSEIVSLSSIDDDISLAVKQQYEKYPYPRWHSAELVLPQEHFYYQARKYSNFIPFEMKNASMLIAGCGTGKHILNSQHPEFKITALDLSLSSLAYAIRNCREYGLSNIKFYQADILNLENLHDQFDIIESCGVLHHTRSIDESFGELYKKLKPQGVFYCGLYSTTARRNLEKIREIIRGRNYKPELSNIRNIRETVMTQLHNEVNSAILRLNDFYSSSMLIDLLFHCNEITVDIPYIKNLAAKYNMRFISFVFDPKLSVFKQYRERFPDDKYLDNLDNWHQFEQENPDTFIAMYQFVLQKI